MADKAYLPSTRDPLAAQTDLEDMYASGMNVKFYDECMAGQGYPKA
jgi:hypothetical protein